MSTENNLLPATQATDLALILGYSFVACLVSRLFHEVRQKQQILAASGAVFITLFAGFQALYVFGIILATAGLIKIRAHPRFIFALSFIWRLLSNVLAEKFSSWNDDNSATGSLIMITTLRTIGVAYEVYDFNEQNTGKRKSEDRVSSSPMLLKKEPSFYDVILYLLACPGQFTGPYYTYRTYEDALNTPKEILSEMKCYKESFLRILPIPFVFILHIYTNPYIGLHIFTDDEFYVRTNVLTRLLYSVAASVSAKQFLVIGWAISESVCLIIGLGVYPARMDPRPGQGPRENLELEAQNMLPRELIKTKWNYDTARNQFALAHITQRSVKSATSTWNCCFQWWLAHHCYNTNAVPKSWKFFRVFFTCIMSAAWHGLKPGFYILFISLPFLVATERILQQNLRPHLGKFTQSLYDLFSTIFLYWLSLSFFGLALFLQEFQPIYRIYSSVYFIPYLILIGSLLPVMLVQFLRGKVDRPLTSKPKLN